MKNCFSRLMKTLAVAVLASVFAASAARSALIIDFGGNMVSSNQNLVLPTPTNDGDTRYWEYDFDTPISPSSSVYSGIPFYGVLQHTSGTGTAANFGRARVGSGSIGEIEIRGSAHGTGNFITGLVFFKPELNPGESVAFMPGDSITMSNHTFTTNPGNPRRYRMAVLNDGGWYLSASSYPGNQTGFGTFTIADAAAEMWGAWDPTTVPLDPTNDPSGSYTTLGSTFTNVEAVGVWFAFSGSSTQEARFSLSGLQVNATTVIPEPHTLGLLLAVGTLLMLRRRLVGGGRK
jgi:hypothetical protein